jgi:flagellar protein FliL
MSKAPAPADEATPPKSKKMLFIVLGAVVLIIVIAAAAVFMVIKSKHSEDADEEEEVVKEKKPKKKAEPGKPPAFVPMEPFTVNLSQEDGGQFLQVVITLRIEDAHEDAVIKALTPQIRNNFLRVLSSQKASDLHAVEGRDKLQELLKDELNGIIDPPAKGHAPEGPVQSVLFTSFIIQ